MISISVVEPLCGEHGWTFSTARRDRRQLNDNRYLAEVYLRRGSRTTPAASPCRCCGTRSATPSSTTNCPKSSGCSTRRSTRSAQRPGDYYPERSAPRSTASTTLVYETVNNGVYRAGFATTQEAYEEAVPRAVRDARLARGASVAPALSRGDGITEADWRLFTTLVRFDAVYYGHFKCNLRRIVDYPNLSSYLRDLYQRPGVAETVEHRPHQAPLLREPRHHQPDPHRAARADRRLGRSARSREVCRLIAVSARWLPVPSGRLPAGRRRSVSAGPRRPRARPDRCRVRSCPLRP